ncbi:protein translocase subunit SecF [Streptomyces sp. SID3343]|uniref:protein translocase subunit SecF n=1 Tax=Streptomyces sp. SID3343 TaxID=2690260 RepID=UPI00136A00B8|nr:protein translocase subunit SecF [Streptomyces sp. SID3343]MYV98918.1 protein translocase subunit SecF [Streptomyces sp. SID3343]
MSRFGDLKNIGVRLHHGDVSFDFVGRKKLWYSISALILVLAVGGLLGRGLHEGIEFKGGSVYTLEHTSASTGDARHAVEPFAGDSEPIVQKVGKDGIRIQLAESNVDKTKVIAADIAKQLNVSVDKVNTQVVGPSWGKEISKKALQGLVIFMILVVIYLTFAFEWRMAVAALIALIHDIVITIGVYALVGFEVTPGTVIGLLTILGYSLYDTVVVFDTVKENTKNITKQTKHTYSEAANLGLNQTLVRSINTTIVALLPVASLLFVGGGLLGAGMLKDIALSLFVGLAAGAFSSIFIATPILADLKERSPEMKELARKVGARRASDAKQAKAAAEAAAASDSPEGHPDVDGETEQEIEAVPAQGGAPGAGASRSRARTRPGGKRKR